MSKASWNQHARRDGTAIVETAVVLPLLLSLVFGAVEYGWMFVVYGEVVNAARAGARLAITPSATAGDVNSQVITALQNAGLNVNGTGGGAAVTPTITVTPSGWTGAASQTIISVQVSIPYSSVSATNFFAPPLVPAALTATVAMAKEGP
jgi:Flp pilus assembly protein TadG